VARPAETRVRPAQSCPCVRLFPQDEAAAKNFPDRAGRPAPSKTARLPRGSPPRTAPRPWCTARWLRRDDFVFAAGRRIERSAWRDPDVCLRLRTSVQVAFAVTEICRSGAKQAMLPGCTLRPARTALVNYIPPAGSGQNAGNKLMWYASPEFKPRRISQAGRGVSRWYNLPTS